MFYFSQDQTRIEVWHLPAHAADRVLIRMATNGRRCRTRNRPLLRGSRGRARARAGAPMGPKSSALSDNHPLCAHKLQVARLSLR